MVHSKKSCVIAGCSRFGATLAGSLSSLGYDVIIVDKNRDAFLKLPSNFGGFEIVGDATDFDVLIEAGIKNVDFLVAATENDNVNCMIAQIASSMFDVGQVFVRSYDIDKAKVLSDPKIKFIFPLTLCINEFGKLANIQLGEDEL